MKCFGDKAKTFHCKVVLLDEQELIQEVQETTTGQDLLDVVFQHLNLIETAYFGLRYIDPSNQTHWLDPNKRLVKQLKGLSPYTLYFSVKFYAADPTKLVEEITRYQFFLQIKQDILQGRLPISMELAAELGSLAVQSELGDYDPRRHSPGYVSEFRFITNQTVPLETKIAELHKKLVSYVPSKAELCYLEKVKWLDMYGVDLHPVLGEDSTEYFLGLTPSGIIVLRNKAKVGNYFWPRITKVYFKGRFFMLRVKDKNNIENTYGFETPSKSACKHLWQCCVEHHAFFRLTQAAGNNPQAMFSIGSKFRYSGRTEKEALNDAKANARPQTEFARTPSRRYQRRIVEGAQDTPRVEDAEHKPETRTVVSLPGTVTPVSHVYRSTSMTLAPRSDSPRSTRSAPHPTGLKTAPNPNGPQRQIQTVLGTSNRREGRPSTRGESPRSIKSASTGRTPDGVEKVHRRTSSVESQSSADSRSCNRSCSRHRRSRCRSSDGESEASSKCSSSKGHRRHHHHHRHHRRHRHHSDDSSEHHKHRHRRHRHSRSSDKQEPQMIESSDQWAKVQNMGTPSRSNTATVRDLTSGYMPSGHDDTEADTQAHTHSSRRKHRKHRSPSENKKNYPDEIRRHIEYNLQNTEGLSESQLKEIPYTKVETAKTVKIRYGSPKGKRHKSPKRSKSNSSERKGTEESNSNQKSSMNNSVQNGLLESSNQIEDDINHIKNNENENRIGNDYKMQNGSLRPCPRSNPVSMAPIQRIEQHHPEECVTSPPLSPHRDSSPLKNFQEVGTLQKHRKEKTKSLSPPAYGPKPVVTTNHDRNSINSGNNKLSYNNHTTYNNQDQNMFKTCNYVTSSHNNISENSLSRYPHQNHHSGDVFLPPLRDSTQIQDPQIGYRREEVEEEITREYVDTNGGGFMSQCPTLLKNATTERNSQFTAVLKPQPSPQSSVTSGISVGSSSASTTVAENSEGESQRMHSSRDDYSYKNRSYDESYTNDSSAFQKQNEKRQFSPSRITNGFHGINKYPPDSYYSTQFQKPYVLANGYGPKEKMNNVNNDLNYKEYNKTYYSAFNGEMRENIDEMLIDKGYHTIEKESAVNYRKNFFPQNKKQSKDRPNSFNQKDKRNETYLNNEYNHKSLEKNHSNPNDNPKMFKPILKSFASEDNLNSSPHIKSRSKSSERLDNVVSLNNNKNRVRWNIQEKNRNMMNLRDVNSYCKNRDYSSLNRSKFSNIQNVKNDVVYAGKGEIIEIKNNQIINIKTAPQQVPSKTFKKENNTKSHMKDEGCTEL